MRLLRQDAGRTIAIDGRYRERDLNMATRVHEDRFDGCADQAPLSPPGLRCTQCAFLIWLAVEGPYHPLWRSAIPGNST